MTSAAVRLSAGGFGPRGVLALCAQGSEGGLGWAQSRPETMVCAPVWLGKLAGLRLGGLGGFGLEGLGWLGLRPVRGVSFWN